MRLHPNICCMRLSATVGGSILGILIGEKILPLVIINGYGIMYKGMMPLM